MQTQCRLFSVAVVSALCLTRAFGASTPSTNPPAPPTGLAAITVPAGFTVELAAGPELAPYAMFGALDERGRLFLAESSGKNIKGAAMAENPECRIRMLEDLNGDGIYDRSTLFADKVGIPMGVLWHHGSLYVASPPDFLRFDDTNGDGLADKRTVILTGWHVRGTASLHGPFLGPDGWLYLTDGRHGFGIRTREGTQLKGLAARIWRCRPDGTGLESFAGGGMDNPVEVVWTPAGEMLGTMTYFTNPMHGQRDSLAHFIEGGVYAKWHECVNEFKQTGDLLGPMTRFARVAPSGLHRYRGLNFGREYRGNLFSAQFNTHRVQRHVLFREGSTYRTEDEDFLTSSDPDFHPCDVLEDADGTLLVVDTGAWYVDQCPLSRIAKPEIRGGIYRVRKADAPALADPRGEKVRWASLSARELARLLEDPRPTVRDRAVELLVPKGSSAVRPLAGLLEQSESSATRCAAVWALHRIGTPKARQAILAALDDEHSRVVQAAAQALGLARDRSAVKPLVRLLLYGEPEVQLAVATALGRIGDPGTAAALLGSAATPADRFVEHALIFALIRLQPSELLAQGLENPHSGVRKAALIALDQMDGSPLRREQLMPRLADADAAVRRAAFWVASRHPEWSAGVIGFLRDRLTAKELATDELNSIREALAALVNDPAAQTVIGELLRQAALPGERRAMLLGVMEAATLKKFPAGWIAAMRSALGDADGAVRLRAVGVARARALGELDPDLKRLVAATDQPADLRIAAVGALLPRTPALEPAAFELLTAPLTPQTAPTLRAAAAQTLSRARLTEGQLVTLARDILPRADALVLPALLDPFRGAHGERAGRALVEALDGLTTGLDALGGGKLEEILAGYPDAVKQSAGPLLQRVRAHEAGRVQRLQELEALLTGGDVGRGRQVFFGAKAACASCHAIGTEGSAFGPDLTSIGAIRSGRDILEAIVFPSATQVPGYETFRVETTDDLHTGIIAQESADAIVLRPAANAELRLPRATIRSLTPGALSLMPEGLDAVLTREELRDLLAFLQSQNGEQWLQPQRLGTQDLRRQAARPPTGTSPGQ